VPTPRAPTFLAALGIAACAGAPPAALSPVAPSTASTATVAPAPQATASTAPLPAPPAPSPALTVLLGGDVELARATGRKLLADPSYDPFATLRSFFARADVRFVNLEGPLSDQHGVTMSPTNPLIFTGPPSGAEALARAGISVVSTANNHAWDYGRAALLETLANLDRAGVAHAGTGATLAAAWAPALVQAGGWRIGFVAVTDVFNFGPLVEHEARDYLARAEPQAVARAIAAARAAGADVVVVSHHGGDEYADQPLARTRSLFHAYVDAGADLVVGHHPHVVQGVEWYAGKPVLYSLGNVLMQMHSAHPWTGFGFFARVTFTRDGSTKLEACPHRILGLAAIPLAEDPHAAALEGVFFAHLREVDSWLGGGAARVGEAGSDGCAELTPEPVVHRRS
jgi:poly-gamma-glutamate synthesis protein (capsule biosynthesis protein)